MKARICFLISTIIIVWSCSGDKKELPDDANLISLNIDSLISDDLIKYSELFSEFHLIPLETTNETIIEKIQNIIIKNDTLFIFDGGHAKKVFLFNMKGNLLGEIGKIGRGPGEYIFPVDFDVNSNEKKVAIYDVRNGKLNYFNYQGEYVENISFNKPFQNFVYADEHIIFYQPPIRGISPQENLIHIFDFKGKEIASFMKYNGVPHYSMLRTMGSQFYKRNNTVRFFMPFNDTIYTVDKDGVEPFISLDSRLYKLNDNERQELNSKPLYSPSNIKKLFWISNYSENDELCFFTFKIGFRKYFTFHFFKSNKTICTTMLDDDLTYIYPSLFQIINNEMIGVMVPETFSRLKEAVVADKIKLNKLEKDRLLEACDIDNNPILVLYKFKNK